MSDPRQKNVSNIEAIVSSIKTDEQVYRWFVFLIAQPGVQAKLASRENLKSWYARLKTTIAHANLVYAWLLISLVAILFLRHFILFIPAFVFLLVLIRNHERSKEWVARISQALILEDFDSAALPNNTLYQICENYSRQYGLPSLVDKITDSDYILRYASLAITILLLLIWPANSILISSIILFLAYSTVKAILKLNIIYRLLK